MKQYVVDAFTDHVFAGNPAAVCVMDKWLDEKTMMAITMENNLSETAFAVKDCLIRVAIDHILFAYRVFRFEVECVGVDVDKLFKLGFCVVAVVFRRVTDLIPSVFTRHKRLACAKFLPNFSAFYSVIGFYLCVL